MRRYTSSHRGLTRASMTTEYQDKFLPPQCYKTVISTTLQKNPYHSLKGTSADTTTFKSLYVKHKWIKNPAKAAQPSMSPRVQQKCTSAPHSATQFVASQLVSKVEDYTSVYKHDFQAWKAIKHQSHRHSDSLKVNHGLLVTDYLTEDVHPQKDSARVETNAKPVPKKKELQPFESITSYRSDYVTHPLPLRTPRQKTVYQNNRGVPLDPAASLNSKVAWNINRELDGTSEFLKHFNTWSLASQLHNQGNPKMSSPAADHSKFLSTTHAHYIPHKCQHTKPILPAMHTPEKSKEPFQALTTMREDYRAWDMLRCVPVGKEETDWKKSPISERGPTPAQGCTANSKPRSLHLKTNKVTVCNSSSHATDKPAENQAEESRTSWSTCVDKGVTWPDGDNCEEPPQAHRDNQLQGFQQELRPL